MHEDFDIAVWVKEARQHAGLSQDVLGERLGKSKGNVSAWENGRHEPSFRQMAQISAITGWPLPGEVTVSLGEGTPAGLVDPDVLTGVVAILKKLSLADQRIALAQLADYGDVIEHQGRRAASNEA